MKLALMIMHPISLTGLLLVIAVSNLIGIYSAASNNNHYKFNRTINLWMALQCGHIVELYYRWPVPLPTWYRPDDLKRHDYKMELKNVRSRKIFL